MFFFRSNSIRRAAHWIVNLRYFDFFIMLIIILSSVALAAEDPINDQSKWNDALDVVDNVFTVIFAIEMVLKVKPHARCQIYQRTNITYKTNRFYVYHKPTGNRSRSDFTSRFVSS